MAIFRSVADSTRILALC